MLLKDVWDAFHKGRALCDSALWKNRAAATSTLAAFVTAVLAISATLGYRLEVDVDTIEALAGGVVAAVLLFNAGVHIVTSEKVGLPPPSAPPRTDAVRAARTDSDGPPVPPSAD